MGYRPRKVGVEILRCQGDLSTEEMIKIKGRLTRLVNKKQKKMVLDLKNAKRVELAGLGMLVDRLIKVREQKGDIRLFNLSPEVQRAFHLVGVSHLLQAFSSEEEAVQSFAA